MKRIFIFMLYLLIVPMGAIAEDYAFSWLPNTGDVDHYEICYGLTPENASGKFNCEDVGNIEISRRIHGTLYGFPDNTLYFFAVIACNSIKCGDPSKVVAIAENDSINIDGDYDGDGLKDNAITDNGYLFIDFAAGGFNGNGCWDQILYADSFYKTDNPYSYDYDGDGITDIAFEDENGVCSVYTDYTMTASIFYDNACSNYVKIGVFRPENRTFYLKTLDENSVITYGHSTDLPITGDWDGNGIVDIGVFRPENRTFYLQTLDGNIVITYGYSTDLPITGDWDGDGKTDIGVFRPSNRTFYLDTPDGNIVITYGYSTDLPITLY